MILTLATAIQLNRLHGQDAVSTLREFAHDVMRSWGNDVYLVGSALRKRKPRDFDLRMELDAADFCDQFDLSPRDWAEQGESGLWKPQRFEWSAVCTRITKRAWRETKLNVDFQIYPLSWARREFRGMDRVRISR